MKQLYTRWGKNLDTKNILPDFATCFILTIEKNVENTALGLYFL